MAKKKLDAPILRHLLTEIKIDIDQVDEIIVRFLDVNDTSLEEFLTKLKNFIESMKEIGETRPKSPPKSAQSKAFDEAIKDFKTADENRPENAFTLTNLLKEKTKDEKGNKIETRVVIDRMTAAEDVAKTLRIEGKEKIQELKTLCESFDYEKNGRLKLATFANILLFNCPALKEDLLVKFQTEWFRGKKESSIDYHTFFEDHVEGKKSAESTRRDDTQLNLNNIMVRVSAAIEASKVNISYAFKFFDENVTNTISRDDFKKVFAWIKANLSDNEYNYLLEHLKVQGNKLDYTKFLNLVEVSSYNIAAIYNRETWLIAADQLNTELLQKAVTNKEYFKYYILQKVKDASPATPAPLAPASLMHKSLAQLKYEFSLKQIDELVNYAIIGSKPTRQDAQKRLGEEMDIDTEIVNTEHFLNSLEDVLAKKKDSVKDKVRGIDDSNKLTESETQENLDQKHIINKIKGIMKDRDITLWDSIISANMNISEQNKIGVGEFKSIINSLNLGLTLRERLKLIQIADPANSGKVDFQKLIEKFDESQLSDKAAKVILEKFAVALFFNDMSLKAVFDFIDESKKEIIFKQELTNGLPQLDLGLSIFEIN